jgi:hypothetical protein
MEEALLRASSPIVGGNDAAEAVRAVGGYRDEYRRADITTPK